MLQQTQVATVIGYYQRFLARFPDVAGLAEADEQEVLTYWAGLGYYRRARQLHAAARQIVAEHGGQFPDDLADIMQLPGIGRYTAGAIASFAYGTRAPIVEANTQRLYSRLIGLREDPTRGAGQAQLWEFAERILPLAGLSVGQVNQATMELGSMVCLPKEPHCDDCPVAPLCEARSTGQQEEIPLAAKRKLFTPLTHACVVVLRRGKALLRQNQDGEWWNGLWDFPRVDLTPQEVSMPMDASQSALGEHLAAVDLAIKQQLGLSCRSTHHLKTLKHGVTRYRIALYCYAAQCTALELPRQQKGRKPNRRPIETVPGAIPPQNWKWVDLQSELTLPLTSTAGKLRKWLLTNKPEIPAS